MANELTSARPYAKAIFELAVQEKKLLEWEQTLNILSGVVSLCLQQCLISNPTISHAQQLDWFQEAFAITPTAKNLVELLLVNKKLTVLPQIFLLFQQMVHAYKNILAVKIISALPLTTEQQKNIISALRNRYPNELALQYEVNSHLLGGIIIYVNDRVIDGSLLGQLQRLRDNLL